MTQRRQDEPAARRADRSTPKEDEAGRKRTRAVVVHELGCEPESWSDSSRGSVQWRTLLSADRTPTRALTMGVAELPPGEAQALALHRHRQPEAYYVLAGKGEVVVSGECHAVQAGSAVFLPGDAVHAARNTGNEVLRILYVFAADGFDEIEYEFVESG